LKNPSKINPVEYKILIELDKVETVTKGGIIIPMSSADRQQMEQVLATIISVGGKAFEDFGEPMPKVGDKVYVAKFAGYEVRGADKGKYKIVNDKDVAAVIGD